MKISMPAAQVFRILLSYDDDNDDVMVVVIIITNVP